MKSNDRTGSFSLLRLARVGNRRHESVFALARVETGMLHHDGHIALDDAGVRRPERDWLGVVQVIETEMLGSPGRDSQPVRTDGIPIGVENSERKMRVGMVGIEHAESFVACKFRRLSMAPGGNITFRNNPPGISNAIAQIGLCHT